MSEEKTVQITLKEYNDLLESANILQALEAHGVDNWEGYSDAMFDYSPLEED